MRLPEVGLFNPAEAADSEFADLYDLARATYVADYPDRQFRSYASFTDQLRRQSWLLGPQRVWVAREQGAILGMAALTLPEKENRELAITDVRVPPGLRRRGIGSALLAATLPDTRTEGRSTITGYGLKVGGDGDKWASSLGFRHVQEFVLQVLDVPGADPALWDVPAPPGFGSERWTGTAPDGLIGGYAHARTAIADAPAGDSSLQVPQWTAERVRQHEAEMREQGYESRVVAAVHLPSGTVAGLTELLISANGPDSAYQQDTAVLPQFRGHGLGRFIKGSMMRWLTAERPEVTRVHTNTDAHNTHMIRVNHQVGYVTSYTVADLEAGLNTLEATLAAKPVPHLP